MLSKCCFQSLNKQNEIREDNIRDRGMKQNVQNNERDVVAV